VPTIDDELTRAESEIEKYSHLPYQRLPYQRPDLTCDMVMKGGISSGVVYPLTICKLATKYRFKSIGGTSAGAIAAVLAAAAEYRRREDAASPGAGFQALAAMPNEIATALPTLFQPHPDATRIFGVLNAQIDPGHTGAGRLARTAWRIAAAEKVFFLFGLLGTLVLVVPGLLIVNGLPVGGDDWGRLVVALVLPLLLALAIGLVAAAGGLARTALRLLPRLDFGLTDGATHQTGPGLTQWLAERIQQVAGLEKDGRPLTLGDLWRTPAADTEEQGSDGQRAMPAGVLRRQRDIDLQVMTTDLTLGRPFRLPFTERTFMFDEDEMSRLFPAPVVAAMKVREAHHLHPSTGRPLWHFPEPDDLPLVVMARMSLSFPGLIAAVPLYAVDRGGDGSVVRHLFSDGGISSNFPMHFFDSLLPSRPTFGIDLTPPHPHHPEKTWRPDFDAGTNPRVRVIDGVGGFAGALRDAVQNWQDNRQVAQRGYADRVVTIRLDGDEGGMNLRMPRDVVLRLVARGAEAGDKLLEFDWDTHRRVRYRIATGRLTDALEQLDHAYAAARYELLLNPERDIEGGGVTYFKSRSWRLRDWQATRQLLGLVDGWRGASWPALQSPRPSPAPGIRMAPE
jgi:predicted acylesterase/phospholipase RssA